MKSGLEGRNNIVAAEHVAPQLSVSMKSGLEGRNNVVHTPCDPASHGVSMKSGLEGRNNCYPTTPTRCRADRLNEVRPRRPEQSAIVAMVNGFKKLSQ